MREKRIEFSKLILVVSSVVYIAIILFSCIMMVRTNDLSPLMYLIPTTGAEVATGTAFYYNKAKAENQIKLRKENDIPIREMPFYEIEGGMDCD